MRDSGINVNMTVSSAGIKLTCIENGRLITNHDMQGISFASGGEKVLRISLSAFIVFWYKNYAYTCNNPQYQGKHFAKCIRKRKELNWFNLGNITRFNAIVNYS